MSRWYCSTSVAAHGSAEDPSRAECHGIRSIALTLKGAPVTEKDERRQEMVTGTMM
jgi:hypothetical protein